IRGATVLAKGDTRRELGFGMRIGAGGLWGGFRWLWTTRRGLLDLYVSRETDVVLVELDPRAGRSLLLTPERPEAFVAPLQRPGSCQSGAALAIVRVRCPRTRRLPNGPAREDLRHHPPGRHAGRRRGLLHGGQGPSRAKARSARRPLHRGRLA